MVYIRIYDDATIELRKIHQHVVENRLFICLSILFFLSDFGDGRTFFYVKFYFHYRIGQITLYKGHIYANKAASRCGMIHIYIIFPKRARCGAACNFSATFQMCELRSFPNHNCVIPVVSPKISGNLRENYEISRIYLHHLIKKYYST